VFPKAKKEKEGTGLYLMVERGHIGQNSEQRSHHRTPFRSRVKQSVALRLICRHLDRGEPQLYQFIGGKGDTGKSRFIEALTELFVNKGMSHRLLVTATSGTAAARIGGIAIHSACNFSRDTSRMGIHKDIDGIRLSSSADRYVDGQARTD
jgi:hypothetical protein